MKNNWFFFNVLLFCCIANYSFSQGCSDAGLCSAGASGTYIESDSSAKNLNVVIGYGIGEQKVSIWQVVPELEFRFDNRNSFQVKLPFISTSGNLGNNIGVGDLVFSYSRIVTNNNKWFFSSFMGMKLPTGKTNKISDNQYSLPLVYQSGLGSTDLIIGALLNYKEWNFSVGYQHILNHNNKNEFLNTDFPASSEEAAYFSSRRLKRGNDGLLRVEKKFNFNKLSVAPGVLGIYRLNKDKIVADSDKLVGVQFSDGLTLNLTTSISLKVSNRVRFQILVGGPVIVRKSRSDGLTRSLVINSGINYTFNRRKKSL